MVVYIYCMFGGFFVRPIIRGTTSCSGGGGVRPASSYINPLQLFKKRICRQKRRKKEKKLFNVSVRIESDNLLCSGTSIFLHNKIILLPPTLQNYPGCAYVFILYLMDLMQIRNQSQLIIDKVYAERV